MAPRMMTATKMKGSTLMRAFSPGEVVSMSLVREIMVGIRAIQTTRERGRPMMTAANMMMVF